MSETSGRGLSPDLPKILDGTRGAIKRYVEKHGTVHVYVAEDSDIALAGVTSIDGHRINVFDDGVTFLALDTNAESKPDPQQVYLYRSDPFPDEDDDPWSDDDDD
jgi:hypothetical protein